MFKTYSMELAGRTLTLETGKMAGLANRKCISKIWGNNRISECNSFKRTKRRN